MSNWSHLPIVFVLSNTLWLWNNILSLFRKTILPCRNSLSPTVNFTHKESHSDTPHTQTLMALPIYYIIGRIWNWHFIAVKKHKSDHPHPTGPERPPHIPRGKHTHLLFWLFCSCGDEAVALGSCGSCGPVMRLLWKTDVSLTTSSWSSMPWSSSQSPSSFSGDPASHCDTTTRSRDRCWWSSGIGLMGKYESPGEKCRSQNSQQWEKPSTPPDFIDNRKATFAEQRGTELLNLDGEVGTFNSLHNVWKYPRKKW